MEFREFLTDGGYSPVDPHVAEVVADLVAQHKRGRIIEAHRLGRTPNEGLFACELVELAQRIDLAPPLPSTTIPEAPRNIPKSLPKWAPRRKARPPKPVRLRLSDVIAAERKRAGLTP